MSRIGIYGWGIVAPRCADVDSFAAHLESSESWLTPFEDVGPSNLLVGNPVFDFADYRDWIDERFPPNKFPQLGQKMGQPTLYAIGAFIQSLSQNPGMEATLQELGADAQVMIAPGLGDLPTVYDHSVELDRARQRWDRFWAEADRNADRSAFESANGAEREQLRRDWDVPPRPEKFDDLDDRHVADVAWNRFWMERSDALARYLEQLNAIESEGVSGDVESGKLRALRRRRTAAEKLKHEYGCPPPPWSSVSANVLWNIHNTPAAQVSMLGRITGAAFAPVAACSTFGVALHLAVRAIRSGEAKAVVIGATDPAPHALTVGTFYAARVLASNRQPSVPLTDLRGTHVSGGACVWIVGDHDYMAERGHRPLGLEVLGVGISSDADHIITPSAEGPRTAIIRALADAGVAGAEIETWDLHATATPGDFQEVSNLNGIVHEGALLTARKGTFGHGMACCGGWELTAQHLGLAGGRLHPTPLAAEDLNPEVAALPYRYVTETGCSHVAGTAGKLSMGVGGINACVVSRPWPSTDCPG